MAKAIILRYLQYRPANPNGKLKRISINLIETIDKAKEEQPGKSVIVLKSGHRRYSCEGVLELCLKYQEAKDWRYCPQGEKNGDTRTQ